MSFAGFEPEVDRAAAELGRETAPERMDAGQAIQTVAQQFPPAALPPDVKQAVLQTAKFLWLMRDAHRTRILSLVNLLFARNPTAWWQALWQNRAAAIQQLARQAGQMAGLSPRQQRGQRPGFTGTQVRQYHRRQQSRGFVPGRNRQTGLYRELELELEQASHELEGPEPFFTRVTPIPGIGNREGHEILTRVAMRGLPLTPPEQSSVLLGVIRPDRGGRSYWNFPRSALESLKAAAQPAHALRPTPTSTVAAALRLIRGRFLALHRRAMRARSRSAALEWLGEALHLLQDSFSSAHVERVGGRGRIRHIRAFYIRFGWPPLSRAPHEHRAPSDPRDDVYLHGALRPEARAAIRASRHFLTMALRHLRTPRSPRNVGELSAFMRRYLSM